MLKRIIKNIPFIRQIIESLDIQNIRDEFVESQIKMIPSNSILLDAGCGSQRYRKLCDKLIYKAQDLGEYSGEVAPGIMADYTNEYKIANLDYKGNVWNIREQDAFFDAIVCTEVFEHIPYPIEAVKEFSRLLKPDGVLILTAPSSSNRHFDPYYYYTGFSDRWYEKILLENNLKIVSLEPVGDYYFNMAVETYRSAIVAGWLVKLILFPSFLYFLKKRKTIGSLNYQCAGYHVVARKI